MSPMNTDKIKKEEDRIVKAEYNLEVAAKILVKAINKSHIESSIVKEQMFLSFLSRLFDYTKEFDKTR